VSLAPELAVREKLLVSPTMVTSARRAIAAAEWPVPVAFWQSSQAHSSIESTSPRSEISTPPQAQRAVISSFGRSASGMSEACMGAGYRQGTGNVIGSRLDFA
jgi:hypothetical protein